MLSDALCLFLTEQAAGHFAGVALDFVPCAAEASGGSQGVDDRRYDGDADGPDDALACVDDYVAANAK